MPDDVPAIIGFDPSDAGVTELPCQIKTSQPIRERYCHHLAFALELADVANPQAVAHAAVEALFTWNDIITGEPCPCGCHPRLPESDRRRVRVPVPHVTGRPQSRRTTVQRLDD